MSVRPNSSSSSDTSALILASTSPYRRELLSRLGVPFETASPGVDELPLAGEAPAATAFRLALAKAMAVAASRPEAIVIGSDQTATLDGRTLIGKPGSHLRAVEQLRAASGRAVTFHTGLAVVARSRAFSRVCVVDTVVRFRGLSDAQIDAYLLREPAYDCAGSAKVEALGIALIAALEGPDPTALVGLPLIELVTMLGDAGCPVL